MFQKHTNEKGFTLIELMIVIAIIGILAAIAIPNFIAYRNKSYCSGAEADANNIASKLANYFSIATHTAKPTTANLSLSLSNGNTATIISSDINSNITIQVTDASTRCPTDYRAAQSNTTSQSYWNTSATAPVYTKIMKP